MSGQRVMRAGMTVITAVAMTTTAGCGAADHGSVIGNISLDNKPLPNATIAFVPQPMDGRPPGVAKTDPQGNYQMPHVSLGMYRVGITTYEEGRPDMEPPIPEVPEQVPTKYNIKTTLVREVKVGENQLDFLLDSQGEIYEPIEDDEEF